MEKMIIKGKKMKLKNPARHVCLAQFDDGRWIVEFRRITGRRQIKSTKLVLTDDALLAVVRLFFDLSIDVLMVPGA